MFRGRFFPRLGELKPGNWRHGTTGENPIAVALALCYCGHDPDGEHQEWLDTAGVEQLAHWTRYVLAQTRGEALGDEGG